ncbi:hypothetical protein CAEBREN_14298 [Caenorhabditis brenneri]|uniref:uridine/cytidine kinase n=1 Tax=Caenorhabditis brenneri TaxID=135651 RepID=G0MYG6_CAEBE|nr:hypothetical protein CAEBREN_14298 [Caenorhabditis brenneri]
MTSAEILAASPESSELFNGLLKVFQKTKPGRPLMIGVCGGSASGKTQFSVGLAHLFGPSVLLVKQDNFYKPLSKEQKELAHQSKYNFDEPDAFDMELCLKTLQMLSFGQDTVVPQYSYITHDRDSVSLPVKCTSVILFEGILAFHDDRIADLFDVRVFIDADESTRLSRRVLRDVKERGWTESEVLEQHTFFVQPAFEKYIAPCQQKAHFNIPGTVSMETGVMDFLNGVKELLASNIPLCMLGERLSQLENATKSIC